MNITTIPGLDSAAQVNNALNAYGVNATVSNANSCQYLYDALLRNYPCMREAYCSPFGTTQTVFMLWMLVACLAALFVGMWLRGYIDEQKRKQKKQPKKKDEK